MQKTRSLWVFIIKRVFSGELSDLKKWILEIVIDLILSEFSCSVCTINFTGTNLYFEITDKIHTMLIIKNRSYWWIKEIVRFTWEAENWPQLQPEFRRIEPRWLSGVTKGPSHTLTVIRDFVDVLGVKP